MKIHTNSETVLELKKAIEEFPEGGTAVRIFIAGID